MKTKFTAVTLAAFCCILLGSSFISPAWGQGTSFTYQGRLNSGGAPASGTYDLTFSLFATNTTGSTLAGPVASSAVAVTNGLFTVTLDFGGGVFTGPSRWLEIAVRTNGGGAFTTLSPRQALTATPYAVFANAASNVLGNVAATQLTGAVPVTQLGGILTAAQLPANLVTNTETGVTLGGAFSGNGGGLTNLNASQLKTGTVPTNVLAGFQAPYYAFIGGGQLNAVSNTYAVVSGGFSNSVAGIYSAIGGGLQNTIGLGSGDCAIGGGSANTIAAVVQFANIAGGVNNLVQSYAGAGFIGGGQNNTIQSNSTWAAIGGGYLNVIQQNALNSFIGGGYNNTVQSGATYATIAGGTHGLIYSTSPYGTVGGGQYNYLFNGPSGTIAGGSNNLVEAVGGAIGGGWNNQAGLFTGVGSAAVVAGGANNDATGYYSSIAGGYGNNVSGNFSGAAGGTGNSVSGDYSQTAGGWNNAADGDNAFAAGRRAKAEHNGSFVWADSFNADFSSTDTNQFLIRANGGVGINTNNPRAALHIVNTEPVNSWSHFPFNFNLPPPTLVLEDLTANSLPFNAMVFKQKGVVTGAVESYGRTLSLEVNDPHATDYDGLTTMISVEITNVFLNADTWVNGSVNSSQDFNSYTYYGTSDRNAKTNFTAVNVMEVLEKVTAMPISTWNFKKDKPGLQHLGPMAQDFYGAFQLGKDDRHIATVDEEGVALAAIQGLNQKLEAENAELQARLEKLERLVAAQQDARQP